MNTTQLIQILTGFIGSIGFAILFNVRGRRLVTGALGGLISWTMFVILSYFITNDAVNYLVVSTTVTVYAEIMARVIKTPTTPLITISLIPLIPGGSLYYTMAYAYGSDLIQFVSKGIDTLKLAAALALGVIIASAVFRLFAKQKKN